MTSIHSELKGRHVRFRLRDLHLPDPATVLDQLHGDEVLEGSVIDTTADVSTGGVYVVIAVDGLPQPVILAAERILGPRMTSREGPDE